MSFGASIVQNLLLSSKFCGQLQALDYSLQPLLKLLSKCDITAGYTKVVKGITKIDVNTVKVVQLTLTPEKQ